MSTWQELVRRVLQNDLSVQELKLHGMAARRQARDAAHARGLTNEASVCAGEHLGDGGVRLVAEALQANQTVTRVDLRSECSERQR